MAQGDQPWHQTCLSLHIKLVQKKAQSTHAEHALWLQFAGMTKLKKAAFLVVARCLSSEEISGLRQLFQSIDTDHSGTITVDELKVCTLPLLLCTGAAACFLFDMMCTLRDLSS